MRAAGQDARGRKPSGLRFTPPGEGQWALALDFPLHLVPGGGLGFVERSTRSPVQPMDKSAPPEIWKVGGDALELSAILRYQRFPRDLQDALRESADGLRLDYYPRLEAENWFFPLRVVGVSEELRADEDPERHIRGEYSWRELRLMHLQNGEGNNGDSFEQLLTGNLLLGPRLYRDSDGDGVADRWSEIGAGAETTYSLDDAARAQKISVDGSQVSQVSARVAQEVFGILPGDQLRLEPEVQEANAGANSQLRLALRWYNDVGGSIQTDPEDLVVTSTGFEIVSFAATAPPDAVSVDIFQGAVGAAGETIDAWFRDAELRRVGEAA